MKSKEKEAKVQKCFHCGKAAIAICDSISPILPTGKTPERPFCENCIVNTPNINIVKWLVPQHEGEDKIQQTRRKIENEKRREQDLALWEINHKT